MKNLIYMLALGWVCCIAGCNCGDCEDPRNPDCKNYNPCIDAKEVKATFKMYLDESNYRNSITGTIHAYKEEILPGDTTNGNPITFEADYPNATQYIWKVGTDARTWTTRKFSLRIDPDVPVSITLIVVAPPNRGCYPNDDGRDTFTRDLRQPFFCGEPQRRIDGRYRGTDNKRPNQPYEIEFGASYFTDSSHTQVGYRSSNWPFGHTNYAMNIYQQTPYPTYFTVPFDFYYSRDPAAPNAYESRCSGILSLNPANRDSITLVYFDGNLSAGYPDYMRAENKTIFKGVRVGR